MGRPLGSKNKPKRRLLQLIQEEWPNYHPVMEMVRTAMDTNNPADLRFNANKEVARYVVPTLAAIKIDADITHNAGVVLLPSSGQSLMDWADQAKSIMQQTETRVLEHVSEE